MQKWDMKASRIPSPFSRIYRSDMMAVLIPTLVLGMQEWDMKTVLDPTWARVI